MMSIVDQRNFPFNDGDGRALLYALKELYVEKDRVQTFVSMIGLSRSDFSWELVPSALWEEVLRGAAQGGRLRRLVEVIADDANSAAYPIFKKLLEPTRSDGDARPHDVYLFGRSGRRVFIDRCRLRDCLKELLDDDGRVLTVTGGKASGKSYTWELIRHVVGARGVTPCLVDVSLWAGSPAGPSDIMRELANQLNWPPFPVDRNEPEDAQARTLLSWFKGRIRNEPEDCWLVFDGLDALRSRTVTESALRLIEGIAIAAGRHEAGGRLRVVLLAFDRPLRANVDVLHESIADIDESELRDFFKNVARVAGARLEDDAADILVRELRETGPAPWPQPLHILGPRAGTLARRLVGHSGVSDA